MSTRTIVHHHDDFILDESRSIIGDGPDSITDLKILNVALTSTDEIGFVFSMVTSTPSIKNKDEILAFQTLEIHRVSHSHR